MILCILTAGTFMKNIVNCYDVTVGCSWNLLKTYSQLGVTALSVPMTTGTY